jgi:hypothetical protein
MLVEWKLSQLKTNSSLEVAFLKMKTHNIPGLLLPASEQTPSPSPLTSISLSSKSGKREMKSKVTKKGKKFRVKKNPQIWSRKVN